jgi:hypothetical protein
MAANPAVGAVRAPLIPGRLIAASAAALLIGAGAGAAVLIDNDAVTSGGTRVIVTEPVQAGAGTMAKDEAAVAAAIGQPSNSPARAHQGGVRFDGGPEEGTRGPGQ